MGTYTLYQMTSTWRKLYSANRQSGYYRDGDNSEGKHRVYYNRSIIFQRSSARLFSFHRRNRRNISHLVHHATLSFNVKMLAGHFSQKVKYCFCQSRKRRGTTPGEKGGRAEERNAARPLIPVGASRCHTGKGNQRKDETRRADTGGTPCPALCLINLVKNTCCWETGPSHYLK